jgi:hypothetical protein
MSADGVTTYDGEGRFTCLQSSNGLSSPGEAERVTLGATAPPDAATGCSATCLVAGRWLGTRRDENTCSGTALLPSHAAVPALLSATG